VCKCLVEISTSWSFELTESVLISLDTIFSRIKWQSISICLVLSWKTRFELIWRAIWLSSVIWMTSPNYNSLSNYLSQISLQVIEAVILYSTFTLDPAVTFLFLTLSRDQIITNGDTISGSESPIKRCCQINIWMTY